MKKTLLAALMTMSTAVAGTLLLAPAPAHAAAHPLICDNDPHHPYSGRYTNVRVPEGGSCYLKDAVVLHNFKSLLGAVDVYLINTKVGNNIKISGVKRDVKIGPRHCKFDPHVGNNVRVADSHNVAICFTRVEENITVTGNDGRIILRNDRAGESILVVDNLPYRHIKGDRHHRLIGAIRLKDNHAGEHIVVTGNAKRKLMLEGNSPTPIT